MVLDPMVRNTDHSVHQGVQIGVDLGQVSDPSAIVVAELQRRNYTRERGLPVRGGEIHYVIHGLERLPLGTSYPDVVERVRWYIEHEKVKAIDRTPKIFLDTTGLGQPVSDQFKEKGIRHIRVFLTGGNAEHWEGNELHLPKMNLVSNLQVLLQNHRVHLPPDAPETPALVSELLTFELKVTDTAHVQFGAFKVGAHDDLAVALGLACRPLPAPDFSMTRVVGLYKSHDERQARERPLQRWRRRL